MSPNPYSTWAEANQRYLSAALAVTCSYLDRYSGDAGADLAIASCQEQLSACASVMPRPPALDVLAATFELTTFERYVILLCAGLELNSDLALRCASLRGVNGPTGATFGIALAALPEPHWSALAPSSPLRHWGLIHLDESAGLTSAPIRLAEHVLHYLTGVYCLDEALRPLIERVEFDGHICGSHTNAVERIAELFRRGGTLPLIQLCGNDRAGKLAVAAAAARQGGLLLYSMQSADIPVNASQRSALLTSWDREAALSHAALLVDSCQQGPGDHTARFVERAHGPVFHMGRDPLPLTGRANVRFDIDRPDEDEQRETWLVALGPQALALNGAIDRVVSNFDFSAATIRSVASEIAGGGISMWESCRSQSRPRLEDLAQRLQTTAAWHDLVVPPAQAETLHEISMHVRQRGTVYNQWGFASRDARGLGISALFYGASGTGKTLAAEVLAAELELDLYRIDLSAVVSKYIGETERNLRRIFDAAEEGGAILLFDEADALFGKRSEVKDSHDRYANIEVSYLLQRMESYRGLAILTTNLKDALDKAFLRRVRFHVEFPFPESDMRAAIWQCVFPRQAPLDNLDIARLSTLNIAGGNIKNVALNAAFLAAQEGVAIGMKHIARAARAEYSKLQRPLAEVQNL